MNVKLLLQVKRAIRAEPAQFVMGTWFAGPRSLSDSDIHRKIPNCRTAACVAGWAVTLGGGYENPRIARRSRGWMAYAGAMTLLGLDIDEASRLFLVSYWPLLYRIEWVGETTLRGRARVASRRIDHFIKTDGRE